MLTLFETHYLIPVINSPVIIHPSPSLIRSPTKALTIATNMSRAYKRCYTVSSCAVRTNLGSVSSCLGFLLHRLFQYSDPLSLLVREEHSDSTVVVIKLKLPAQYCYIIACTFWGTGSSCFSYICVFCMS